MVQLVKTLCHQIQQLQARSVPVVEQLELRTKKTVLTVICRLLRIWGALAPSSPLYGRKPENVQVDRPGIGGIHFKRCPITPYHGAPGDPMPRMRGIIRTGFS
jgi:hypothetical protein